MGLSDCRQLLVPLHPQAAGIPVAACSRSALCPLPPLLSQRHSQALWSLSILLNKFQARIHLLIAFVDNPLTFLDQRPILSLKLASFIMALDPQILSHT